MFKILGISSKYLLTRQYIKTKIKMANMMYLTYNLNKRKNMKKINLSQFRKRDSESFEVVKKALDNSFFRTNVTKNSTIKLNTLIDYIPDSDAKKKFVLFSDGFDFAVIDVV